MCADLSAVFDQLQFFDLTAVKEPYLRSQAQDPSIGSGPFLGNFYNSGLLGVKKSRPRVLQFLVRGLGPGAATTRF